MVADRCLYEMRESALMESSDFGRGEWNENLHHIRLSAARWKEAADHRQRTGKEEEKKEQDRERELKFAETRREKVCLFLLSAH